jgi:hypothetical protein
MPVSFDLNEVLKKEENVRFRYLAALEQGS